MAEEGSRGRCQPKKAASQAERRKISRLSQLLTNPHCDEREYLAAIRDLGLKDESREFAQLVKLWREFRGRSG